MSMTCVPSSRSKFGHWTISCHYISEILLSVTLNNTNISLVEVLITSMPCIYYIAEILHKLILNHKIKYRIYVAAQNLS